MTTITYQQKRPNLGLVFILLLVFIVVIAFATLDTTNSHAVTKHGTDGAIVRNCISNGGTLEVFPHATNPDKELWLCEPEPGVFGCQIRISNIGGGQDEVTCFIKNKMRKLEDVLRYIKNSGYIIGG